MPLLIRTAFVITLFTFSLISVAQSSGPQRLNSNLVTFINPSPSVYLNLSANKPFRYSALRYVPTKINNTHVISTRRHNQPFDDVYYINEKGETEYHSIAITAPINRFPNSQQKWDSFNPTGAETLKEAVFQGLWNAIYLLK